ncbi:MAG TPA: hypothetical protein IAA59_02940 [Candidatus Faecaligallichristensenella faecipullorum]|nr:hypothetical protein [Candidatus Faecaligallichristensenella faecipullorum]
MKYVPLKKQSKRLQKEYARKNRGSWNGVIPVTRVVEDKTIYNRKRLGRAERGLETE